MKTSRRTEEAKFRAGGMKLPIAHAIEEKIKKR